MAEKQKEMVVRPKIGLILPKNHSSPVAQEQIEMPDPAPDTLLKYDNPVLVNKSTDRKSPKGGPLKVSPQQPIDRCRPVPPPPKPNSASTEATKQNEEILNAILPPREWTEGNQVMVQKVSSAPCTRTDVLDLEHLLDTKLQQRLARDTGICPIRRELYSQCFDELIRQVTINCAERGMLLLRIRDEIQMTIAAYRTLYESSIALGMRKSLQAEEGECDIKNRILELENEIQELKKELNEEKAKCDIAEMREAEKRQLEEERYNEEIQFLKRTNQELKAQLEQIIAPKK